MNIGKIPGDGGQHYRPNLRPADPGKAYKGRHKVEVLSQKGEGKASIEFPKTQSSKDQMKSMMKHTFTKLDSTEKPEIGILAQRMIQPRSNP